MEIKSSNLPLINFNKNNNHIYYDFFIKNNITLFNNKLNNNLDNIFFYIMLFKCVQKYKNV